MKTKYVCVCVTPLLCYSFNYCPVLREGDSRYPSVSQASMIPGKKRDREEEKRQTMRSKIGGAEGG